MSAVICLLHSTSQTWFHLWIASTSSYRSALSSDHRCCYGCQCGYDWLPGCLSHDADPALPWRQGGVSILPCWRHPVIICFFVHLSRDRQHLSRHVVVRNVFLMNNYHPLFTYFIYSHQLHSIHGHQLLYTYLHHLPYAQCHHLHYTYRYLFPVIYSTNTDSHHLHYPQSSAPLYAPSSPTLYPLSSPPLYPQASLILFPVISSTTPTFITSCLPIAGSKASDIHTLLSRSFGYVWRWLHQCTDWCWRTWPKGKLTKK